MKDEDKKSNVCNSTFIYSVFLLTVHVTEKKRRKEVVFNELAEESTKRAVDSF